MNHLLKILASQHESIEPALIKEILEIFKENNFNKSIPLLKKIYHTFLGDELKKTVLQAFSVFGDSSLNPFLLAELGKGKPVNLAYPPFFSPTPF